MRRILYLPLLIAAVALLAAPASSLAAKGEPCPPGYKGTVEPYCEKEPEPTPTPTPPPTPTPTPPPPLTTVATSNEVVTGAVKVTFNLPGPGTLTIKGNAIKIKKIRVTAAGSVTVTLRATGKVLQHLENRGWTQRKQIFATFTAANGSTQTVKVIVRFRKP
jgi:hypothetical protein